MPALPPIASPFQIVLVSPQIAPNVGNVARTCAVTGSTLHLVGPLGFSLDDRQLRRAGLDYWPGVQPTLYSDWPDFADRALGDPSPGAAARRLHLFTARAERSLFGASFSPGDFLVFGHEQLGLPPALLEAHPERQVGIPLLPGQRSLNLAVAVGVAVYAGLAQVAFGRNATELG
jgi:tRNA (cytidine/uridine-2'-O-)-methyltransferase